MMLTAKVGQDKIDDFCQFFAFLQDRWNDEGWHEDWDEYVKAVEKRFGFPVVKFTKHPWKVIFDVDGIQGTFQVKGNQILWGTIR